MKTYDANIPLGASRQHSRSSHAAKTETMIMKAQMKQVVDHQRFMRQDADELGVFGASDMKSEFRTRMCLLAGVGACVCRNEN